MATGKIVQVIGTVVDVEFPSEEMPGVFNALETKIGDQKLNSVSEIIHSPIDKPNKSKPIPKSSPYTHLV